MLEPEAAFCSLQDVMTIAEDMITAVMRTLLTDCADELSFLQERGEGGAGLLDRAKAVVGSGRWPRLTYTDAVQALQQSGRQFEHAVQWGAELQSEHERWLAETHCRSPVFVTHFPRGLKPFYMKTDDSSLQDGDGSRATALCFDLLVPGVGELVGGSQREDRYEQLKQRMEQAGLPMDQYSWYLDLRKSARDSGTDTRGATRLPAPAGLSSHSLLSVSCCCVCFQVRLGASQRLRFGLRALPALRNRRVQHQRPHRRAKRAWLAGILSEAQT